MLLEFRMQNFRSFYNETVFSMIASKQREHQDRLLRVGKGSTRVLPSAVVYGANASGKTNLIMGLALLREVVKEGNIKDSQENDMLAMVELYPFIHDYGKFVEPIKLEATFVQDSVEFTYGLEFRTTLGSGDVPNTRQIISEYLTADGNEIFTRTEEGVRISNATKALKYYKDTPAAKLWAILEGQINDNLDASDLFLSNAFRSVINSALAQQVIKWFDLKLSPFLSFDEGRIELALPEKAPTGRLMLRNNIMNALLRHADFGPQDVAYVLENTDQAEPRTTMRSQYRISGRPQGENIDVASELLESKGTLRILKFALPFISALRDGLVLVMDELDSSIHPDLIAGIIRIFNNPEFNKNGAQLIFNTHNPIYLDRDLFRRDQIIFVSRDRETYQSELYTLADFKTTGENRVRGDERYLRNYLSGKYGALPFVDFEGAIRAALKDLGKKG